MKICILSHTFPKTPNDQTAAFMHPFVKGISKFDDVTVLVPYHPDIQPDSFDYPVIPYKYIWPDSLHLLGYSQTLRLGMRMSPLSYMLAPFLYIAGSFTLFKLLRREKFDVVSAHWILPNGWIAAFVTRFLRIPFIVTLAGSDAYIAQKNILFRKMARFVTKNASVVCADSPLYFNELRKGSIESKHRMVIPYPVEISSFKKSNYSGRLKKRFGISKKTQIILSIGRLVEKKGLSFMIAAMPKILRRVKDTKYIIIGDGDMAPILHEEVKRKRMEGNILFMNSVNREEISSYYKLADIVVVPSIRDSDGNVDDRAVVIIEAMASERAVIATDFPGNRLTISSGTNGILTPQKDVTALAKACILLLKSPKYRSRIGAAARETIEDRFTNTVVGKKYHNLFIKVARAYG